MGGRGGGGLFGGMVLNRKQTQTQETEHSENELGLLRPFSETSGIILRKLHISFYMTPFRNHQDRGLQSLNFGDVSINNLGIRKFYEVSIYTNK